MADVWANSMACHPRATCHTAGCCQLANSCHDPRATCHIAGAATGRIQRHVIPEPRITLQSVATWWIHCYDSRATCHIAGCSHLAKSMSFSCHIAGCNNFIRHIDKKLSYRWQTVQFWFVKLLRYGKIFCQCVSPKIAIFTTFLFPLRTPLGQSR